MKWYGMFSSFDDEGSVFYATDEIYSDSNDEPEVLYKRGTRADTFVDWFDNREDRDAFVEDAKAEGGKRIDWEKAEEGFYVL